MTTAEITVDFAPELRLFIAAAQRAGPSTVRIDDVSTLGHVVESLGVPLTEVGALVVDGRPVEPAHLPVDGEAVSVRAVVRPQHIAEPLRFLLDIHLGTLARRLRLLGVDAAYEKPDIGDAALATRSAAEHRILLSRDRGLLRRREIFAGAYIYSHRPAEQLDDVLSRFAPPLAPWTRCTACNGPLRLTDKQTLRGRIPDDTERTYDAFAQCVDCGRTYWKGAHHESLDAIVTHALQNFGT
ncbi:Mut7-C RNAse domain-containing protein [Nocardia nepalensis]|uniref:Mut7-C RNAse domain-containing protein n=1 Tax=Nocardia nepalensis TaxID=3375448 RepID=UPI003B6750B5